MQLVSTNSILHPPLLLLIQQKQLNLGSINKVVTCYSITAKEHIVYSKVVY
jgi:hypothetical protein